MTETHDQTDPLASSVAGPLSAAGAALGTEPPAADRALPVQSLALGSLGTTELPDLPPALDLAAQARPGEPRIAPRFHLPIWGLTAKLAAMVTVAILVSTVALAFFVIRGQASRQEADLVARGRALASMMAKNAEYPIYIRDQTALGVLTSSLQDNPEVAYVAISGADGVPLATWSAGVKEGVVPTETSPPPTGEPSEGGEIREEHWEPIGAPDEILEVVAPVISEPLAGLGEVSSAPMLRPIGAVRVGLSLEIFRAQTRQFLYSVTAFTALLGSLLVAIAVALGKRLTRPIRLLQTATRSVAQGKLDTEISIRAGGEIGELAADYSEMLRRLRSSQGELERRHREAADANLRLTEEVRLHHETELELRRSEQRYELAGRAANDGLWDWDWQADRVYFAPRWQSMLGLEEGTLSDAPQEWFGRVHTDDFASLRQALNDHVAGRTPQLEAEYRIQHADGSWRWMLSRGIAVSNEAGQVTRLAGSQSDITERKLAQERLLHDALHDELTGLPNRALLLDRVDWALSRIRRNGTRCAVLFLDLDRFKHINDSLGHPAGDRLLVEAARRLRASVRELDTVARLGGDEFVVLMEGLQDGGEANRLAERIRTQLGAPFDLDGQEVVTTASVGIALSENPTDTADTLLRNADLAMYQAKSRGDACQLYDEEMHEIARVRLQLESDLRRGIERGELRLQYQPIFDLRGNRIEMLEALVRWEHPTAGLLPPGSFIPLAEESNLIVPLGQWVLREAARQQAAWRRELGKEATPPICVNVSGKEFMEPEFMDRLAATLEQHGLDAGAIALELTESVVMDRGEAAVERTLGQVRELGVQVLIDDFGTGLSSLANLHRFPVGWLKIDRSFVARMLKDADSLEIVRTILQLARSLKMRAVAEGVETAEQLAKLRVLGCPLVQGFYLARPAAPDKIAELLLEKSRPAHLRLMAAAG